MINPFKYGEIVSGDGFIDREEETNSISRELINGLKCFLISPRRYGKTSLIKKIIERLKRKGLIVVYIDLYGVSSLEQLALKLAEAYAQANETKMAQIWRFIKDLIPQLRPTFTIEPDGKFTASIDVKEKKGEIFNILSRLFEYPVKIKAQKDKPCSIIYDEFQEITELGGVAMEKMMRSIIQHHTGIGYLFSGSKKHIMLEMTTSSERAFYKMGPVFFLEKIQEKYWQTFIKNTFRKAGIDIVTEDITRITTKVNNVPYYIQYLCHELWELSLDDKQIDESKIEYAVKKISQKLSSLYTTIWDSFTLNQKQLLQVIAGTGGKNIFSNDFLGKCKMTPATVQKSVQILQKKEILEKENGEYAFSDVWFKEWLKTVS